MPFVRKEQPDIAQQELEEASRHKRRLPAASEKTDDALDLSSCTAAETSAAEATIAKMLIFGRPLNYRGAFQTKNEYEKTQLDNISKLCTDGQLLTISTVSVQCRTEQARTH